MSEVDFLAKGCRLDCLAFLLLIAEHGGVCLLLLSVGSVGHSSQLDAFLDTQLFRHDLFADQVFLILEPLLVVFAVSDPLVLFCDDASKLFLLALYLRCTANELSRIENDLVVK